MGGSVLPVLPSMLQVLPLLLSAPLVAADGPPRRTQVVGRQLFVNGDLFEVRGVCYSPVPINESVYFAPYGDYFTKEYSFIWLRDLPLIKAMGANVVRIYGWTPTADHTDFLKAVHANGLYLMATFYMGDAAESPVSTAEDRQKLVDSFRQQVRMYKDYPALLFWSFGNELNGVWNGYLQQLSHSQEDPCAWDERYDDKGGCWVHKLPPPTKGSPCWKSSFCVYKRLFEFINSAVAAAKEEADVLVVSAFADVDALYDKVERAGHFAPALDAWTAQVYRGSTFGNFFQAMSNATDKPVLLTEYGVDSYHDVCGAAKTDAPCYNMLGDSSGSFEDQDAQAQFALNLTREIRVQSAAHHHCSDARRGSIDCTTLGGFLMSWVDEFWKGAKSQASCDPTYSSAKFSVASCDPYAHVTCGNWNASQHDLCGYWLEAAPDHYVNEEWFGITSPTRCGDEINSLRAREVFWTMRKLWTGQQRDESLFPSCDEMLLQQCNFAPTDMTAIGGPAPGPHPKATQRCSGHGTCTTDWKVCGAGGANKTATPCCTCEFGFAGDGCEQFDARILLSMGALGMMALLAVLMIGTWAVGALQRSCTPDALASARQPLISS